MSSGYALSLPLWERGLKLRKQHNVDVVSIVAPLVGAWIEILVSFWLQACFLSLPLWERGLKSGIPSVTLPAETVAPLVGAWIEIIIVACVSKGIKGRSPCGSVD